jgi:hypothetical protein
MQANLLRAGVSSVDLYATADQLSMDASTLTLDTGMPIGIDDMMGIVGIDMNQIGAVAAASDLVSLADNLKSVEQTIYSDAIVHALSDHLDYETCIKVGEYFTAIEAVKDHETMVILVDGADILTDQIGLSGTTCVQKQEEFQKALSEEGVDMELHLKKHLDPHGGDYADVIKAAGRMHAGSLAKDIVEYVKMNPGKNPMKTKKLDLRQQSSGQSRVLV